MVFASARNLTGILLGIVMCLSVGGCHRTPKPSSADLRRSRLDWDLKTTVDAYRDFGSSDPKWDEAATNALREFALTLADALPPGENGFAIIQTNCLTAIQEGCDDPLVMYLFIRYAMDQTNSREAFASAFAKTVKDMEDSHYPPIRKFYVAARALDQANYTYGNAAQGQAKRAELWSVVTESLNAALADKTMPGREAAEAAMLAFGLVGGQSNLEQLYQMLEQPLFANWPDEYAVWLFKGIAYKDLAWAARGGGYADTVTADRWKIFFDDLALADAALQKAWQLDTNDERIPIQMITVLAGEQKSDDEMALWFNRAMTIDPACYEACHTRLQFLYPRWGGSREAMLAFGRECVANTDWSGKVPLILLDAHWEYCSGLPDGQEKTNYWTQPDVWPDIQAAYDRFFAVNPAATNYYYQYAWYAGHCEQWDAFLKLIPKLGPVVTYSYFGGEDAYRKMVETAKAHVDKSP